jgi:hypothetical protein
MPKKFHFTLANVCHSLTYPISMWIFDSQSPLFLLAMGPPNFETLGWQLINDILSLFFLPCPFLQTQCYIQISNYPNQQFHTTYINVLDV